MCRLIVLAVFLVVSLTACGGGEATGGESGSADLVASDFSFNPAGLTAPTGQETAFEVANDGGTTHNVTIEALAVDQDIEAGEHTFVTVTPGEAGEFSFFCSFHPSEMTGTLTVE